MIRLATRNGTEYIVIDSSFEINGIKTPLHVQINLKGISEKDKLVIFKASSIAFNRHINLTKPKPIKQIKPWWKVW